MKNNHINNLQNEANALRSALGKQNEKIRDFMAFLQTAEKFQGVQSDGSRKDWISTADAINRLRDIVD